MLDKLKRAFSAYKKMGKVKKFFLTTIVSIVTIVTVFFGGIFISAFVDVIKNPDTSVQFSYKSAFTAFATIEPVTSEPPLENVLIVSLGIIP